MSAAEIQHLVTLLSRLPGLGPRSARRMALHLLRRRETLLLPLAEALATVADRVRTCPQCGNLDTVAPCAVCTDATRNRSVICVVEGVPDLWALERTRAHDGLYHVLGGTLSALDGIGPEDLAVEPLLERARAAETREVILALNGTVEGQATVHYLTNRLSHIPVTLSRLAQGVPLGGELDYLDEGTLTAALKARRTLKG